MINIKQIFDNMGKNSIEAIFDFKNTDSVKKGCSKFGGKPDLPQDFRWPYYMVDGCCNEEVKNRPLTFLAQINCEEVSIFDTEGLLPEKGILYFFYEMDSQKWGFDPNDKGCARVFYFDVLPEKLISTEFPCDFQSENIMPEIPLGFEQRVNMPTTEEFLIHYEADRAEWEEYDVIRERQFGRGEDCVTKLLGYADIIQDEMLTECELASRHVYTGDGYPEMTKEEEAKLNEDSRKWLLLFQLDTIENENFELMFGDCGRIYFYIREKDLKNKNFDDTWLVLQCY